MTSTTNPLARLFDQIGLTQLIAPMITLVTLEGPKAEVTVECKVCHRPMVLKVELEDLKRYFRREELIQNIFPYLVPELRELLLSGICPKCWIETFGTGAAEAGDEDL